MSRLQPIIDNKPNGSWEEWVSEIVIIIIIFMFLIRSWKLIRNVSIFLPKAFTKCLT